MAKKALALYQPAFPMQLSTAAYPNDVYTKQYLSPTGLGSGPYGPLLRDAPLSNGSVASGYELANAKTEVNQAKAGGLDGFAVLVSTSVTDGSTDVSKFANAACQAATDLGSFATVPVLDLSVAEISALSASAAAALLNHYLGYASTWKESTSYVVAALHAETWTASQWSALTSALATLGKTALVLGCFDTTAPADSGIYDSVMWALSMPGGRSTASTDVTAWTTRGNAVQGRSRLWVAPIAFQDERPSEGVYDEASNTETLLAMHHAARNIDADHLLLWTWNDYESCSAFAPSRDKGTSLLDANKHFLYWWKNPGSEPNPLFTSIGKEMILLSHRKQFAADRPSYPETQLMTLRPGSTAARDTLEALTLLGGPGTLVLQSGTSSFNFTVDAGSAAHTVPLQAGAQKASIVRAPTPPTPPSPPTLGNWKLVWSDEFDGTALDGSKWNLRTDTQSNHKGHNTADNVVVSGGTVKLKAGINTGSDSATKPWTSSYITTAGKFAFQYGRIDIRARMTWGFGAAGQGMWPAQWFRPDGAASSALTDAEIDLMEAWLGINDLHATLWYDEKGTYPHKSSSVKGPPFDPAAWHVYRMDKLQGSLKFYIDDVLWWDATNSATWRAACLDVAANFHVRLQVQVGATSGYGGDPDGGTDFSGAHEVDYVRYYVPSA